MVAAKLSSGELPGEGSEQGAEGGGWEDLKGQRQVLRWQDAWGVRCVMDVTGSRAASARSVTTCRHVPVSLRWNEGQTGQEWAEPAWAGAEGPFGAGGRGGAAGR